MTEYSGLIVNVIGWIFMLGLTIGYMRTSIANLEKRLSRIEDWIISRANGHR